MAWRKNNYKIQFKIIMALLLLGNILLIFTSVQAAADLIPQPKFVQYKGFDINMNNDWVIVGDTQNQRYNFTAVWLKRKLNACNSLNFRIANFSDAPPSKRIVLGNAQEHSLVKSLFEKKSLKLPHHIGGEGYALHTSGNEIIIAGGAPNGVFYGVQTILQLINKNNSIQGVSIIDYPDHKIRAVYMNYFGSTYMKGSPSKFTQTQKDAIDRLAGLKINTLSHSDKGDFFRDSPEYIRPYKEMVEYCRKRFIDFIPNIGSLRGIRGLPFELLEGWWIKDEKFKFGKDGVAVAEKPFINLFDNGDFEIDKDLDGKPDGWTITGSATIDGSKKHRGNNSLKINSGRVFVELPSEPDKHYYLTAFAKGASPVVSLKVVTSTGSCLYSQNDYIKTRLENWRKFGVVIKTNDQTDKVCISLSGKKGVVWVDAIRFYRVDGGLKNAIRTNSADIEVTNLNKTRTFQEGLDYEVINGETNKIFDNKLQPFQVKRLPAGNIAHGQKALVSYDSVLYWSLSHYSNQPPCVSCTSLYTDYYYPAIDRVIEHLKPQCYPSCLR